MRKKANNKNQNLEGNKIIVLSIEELENIEGGNFITKAINELSDIFTHKIAGIDKNKRLKI